MPDRIDIDTEALALYEDRMEKLIAAIRDLRPFWPMVIPLYVRWMGEQFESAGTFFGEQWAPLSAHYAAWKTHTYPGRGILMAEGDLRHAAQTPRREATATTLTLSIEPFVKPRGPGRGREIDPTWFQHGTDRMPARPLLPITGELENATAQRELAGATEEYVRDTALRLGLL